MYGWRGRIGIILPVDNVVMEPELYGAGLEGVSFHFARLATSERSEMPGQGMALARIFPEMGVDAIVYACAETSFLDGEDGNQRIIREIEAAAGLPAITATQAMVEALRHIGAPPIGLVTPYTAPRGKVMAEFLSRSGIPVAASLHRDFQAGTDEAREWFHTNIQPPTVAYRMAVETNCEQVGAILVSATNFRTFEIISTLERDLGKPVITCNQAILWWCLRRLGLSESLPHLGRLLGEE